MDNREVDFEVSVINEHDYYLPNAPIEASASMYTY